jgi:hypothetical protein
VEEELEINIRNRKEGMEGEGKNEEEKGKKTEKENDEKKQETIHRIVVTQQADDSLNQLLERVNNGFVGGRVNRTQIMSWLLFRQAEIVSENYIQDIRSEFFDEVALLESILRQAKATGKLPTEYRGILQKRTTGWETPKKEAKKQLTKGTIIVP